MPWDKGLNYYVLMLPCNAHFKRYATTSMKKKGWGAAKCVEDEFNEKEKAYSVLYNRD